MLSITVENETFLSVYFSNGKEIALLFKDTVRRQGKFKVKIPHGHEESCL